MKVFSTGLNGDQLVMICNKRDGESIPADFCRKMTYLDWVDLLGIISIFTIAKTGIFPKKIFDLKEMLTIVDKLRGKLGWKLSENDYIPKNKKESWLTLDFAMAFKGSLELTFWTVQGHWIWGANPRQSTYDSKIGELVWMGKSIIALFYVHGIYRSDRKFTVVIDENSPISKLVDPEKSMNNQDGNANDAKRIKAERPIFKKE